MSPVDNNSPDNPWAVVRLVLNGGSLNPDADIRPHIAMAVEAGIDDLALDKIKEFLTNGELVFKDTFAEQAPNTYESIAESNPEQTALIGAIYEGITKFLNSLDSDRCAEILFARGKAVYEAGEDENYADLQTMFDQVIEKNISFE